MTSDLRYAWRALWKSPITTLGAMLALALGIGATTTMFGLLNAVALRPLPYPESDRLVELWGDVERQVVERRGTSIPDYLDWKAKTTSFDQFSAWSGNGFIRRAGTDLRRSRRWRIFRGARRRTDSRPRVDVGR
jgi:putative ABC transport system permease protein